MDISVELLYKIDPYLRSVEKTKENTLNYLIEYFESIGQQHSSNLLKENGLPTHISYPNFRAKEFWGKELDYKKIGVVLKSHTLPYDSLILEWIKKDDYFIHGLY